MNNWNNSNVGQNGCLILDLVQGLCRCALLYTEPACVFYRVECTFSGDGISTALHNHQCKKIFVFFY